MSNLKNARIKSYIEQNFAELINVSHLPSADQAGGLLTRGLAALAVISKTGCSFPDAANSIVDGGQDNGIDAIYFDTYTNAVYFVQSKWSDAGNKTIDEAAALKLTRGVQKLLDLDFDDFNDKVKSKKRIIEKITSDASVKIVLCVTYNSINSLADSVESILDEYIGNVNGGIDIMQLAIANQSKIYDVASKSRGPVDEDIVLRNWTKIDIGMPLYYGQIAVSDLANLFNKHQDSLFVPNIRAFKGDTEVNNLIVESIVNTPEMFCCLNNGITIIANEIHKKPLGGASRDSGIFECKGVAVVNGAQTVGACNRAFELNGERASAAYVIAKMIETGQPDNDISIAITKAANTQNKIERKDFVALDTFQKDLKEGLDILDINYVYKTGEDVPSDGKSFDLSFVTQALIADTSDIALIAIAKREIGKVWDDINKAPYKTLFNPTNNAYYIKNILQLFSKIQDIIRTASAENKRMQQYTIHGNVFIASQCLKRIEKDKIRTDVYDINKYLTECESIASSILNDVYTKFEEKHPGAYLAHLFRNAKKLAELDAELI